MTQGLIGCVFFFEIKQGGVEDFFYGIFKYDEIEDHMILSVYVEKLDVI